MSFLPKDFMKILRNIGNTIFFYTSEVFADKVMIVTLNNSLSSYRPDEAQKLREDIARARREKLVILIFQHEPLCTRNPKEKELMPIRENDRPSVKNFCDNFIGNLHSDEATMEVYKLITENADVIKAVFCGHLHSDYYTEIIVLYEEDGKKIDAAIPQYILTGNMYDEGHVMIITIDE